jgi:fatty acid desaturase 2 (delta-6 desaturase)
MDTEIRNSDIIIIDGTSYDITNFKHPGGNIINYAKNSPDATDIFNEFHHRSLKANKVLKSLPLATFSKDDDYYDDSVAREGVLTKKQQEMTADFREMRANLVEQGLFEPDYIHVYFRLLEIAFYFSIGTWLASYNIYASIISFIAFKTRCGWAMHECGHLSFTGNHRIDRALQTFILGFGSGASSSVWNSMHQKHHAAPQKVKYDVDLDTTPFVAFFDRAYEETINGKAAARFMNRWWMRFQAWTFLPIVNGILVPMFWLYYLHPKKVFNRLYHLQTKYSAVYELACMLSSHIVIPYIFYTSGYNGARSIIWCYFIQMFINFCTFVFLFGHFSLSHTFTGVVPENKHLLWFEYAINHTVNISTKSALVTWTMGYLNFQIEHHLFPSMPQYKNALAAPYVRRFCKKWSGDGGDELKYKEYSYITAWKLMLSNLNRVGKHYYENGIEAPKSKDK